MVAPITIGGGITFGGGISVGNPSSPTPPGIQWDSNPGTHILEFVSNGDGTGTVTYYCANCTNQTVDPGPYGYGYLTYFQVWIRNENPGGTQPQTQYTVYDATLGQSYTITPTSAATTFSGGIIYTCQANSTAPSLTNGTIINQP